MEMITIGILNMNGRERLGKVLPSILNQKYRNKEILIVDNGSTDGSIEFIRGFREIRLIENGKNLGYGAAKNILVRNARGKYVLMLDNDIHLNEENFAEKIFSSYQKIEKCAFLSPLVIEEGADSIASIGLVFTRIQKKYPLALVYGKEKFIQVGSYSGNVVFFRKKFFLEIGGFDEKYPFNLDDYDLGARASVMGYKNYVDAGLLAVHHGADTRNDIKWLSWKNQYYLSGFGRMIVKNYKNINIILYWPPTFARIFYKTLKIAHENKNPGHVCSFFKSFCFFIRDFPDTLKLRREIQKKRVVKDDFYLNILPYKPGGSGK